MKMLKKMYNVERTNVRLGSAKCLANDRKLLRLEKRKKTA